MCEKFHDIWASIAAQIPSKIQCVGTKCSKLELLLDQFVTNADFFSSQNIGANKERSQNRF